jgi:hypothetical protein
LAHCGEHETIIPIDGTFGALKPHSRSCQRSLRLMTFKQNDIGI